MSPILLSAETYTLPSGVAPFPGAETGTGGRIRDVQAMNAKVTVSTVGYSVGVLNIPGYELPWDVHVRDLLSGSITLEAFRRIVFVGGFSYADVLESVRGWRTVGDILLRLSSLEGHYP